MTATTHNNTPNCMGSAVPAREGSDHFDLPWPLVRMMHAAAHSDAMLFQWGHGLCSASVNEDLRISWSLGPVWCARKAEQGSAFCWLHDVWNVAACGTDDEILEWLADRGVTLLLDDEAEK